MTLSIARLLPNDSDSVVLSLRGTLDHLTAPHLHAAINMEAERVPRPRSIVVDLTGVEQIDPAGMGSLVAGNRSCAVAGVGLAVRGSSPLVRALLQLRMGSGPTTASKQAHQWCTPGRLASRLRRARDH